jgi:hypothetical protein
MALAEASGRHFSFTIIEKRSLLNVKELGVHGLFGVASGGFLCRIAVVIRTIGELDSRKATAAKSVEELVRPNLTGTEKRLRIRHLR